MINIRRSERVMIYFVQFPFHNLPIVFSAMIKCQMSRSTVYYSVNLLTCTLCTAGVNRTGLGPNGVVVWSWVYLLGGWNRVVGETMLGSEKKSFNYYKEGTFDTQLIKWQQVFYNCNSLKCRMTQLNTYM